MPSSYLPALAPLLQEHAEAWSKWFRNLWWCHNWKTNFLADSGFLGMPRVIICAQGWFGNAHLQAGFAILV